MREEEREEKGLNRAGSAYLKFVGVGNVVVRRTQVGRGGDEVHVEVCVVVLLETDRVHLVAWIRRGRGELGEDLVAQRLIILSTLLIELV